MKERIKFVRANTGKNQTEFGNMLMVSKSAVQKWESGENVPTDAVLELMAQKTGANILWLRTGAGEAYAPPSRAEELGRLVKSLMADRPEAFRARLITALLRFDPDGPEWQVLENIYDSVAAQAEKEKDDR